jgi:hypothetical protein
MRKRFASDLVIRLDALLDDASSGEEVREIV